MKKKVMIVEIITCGDWYCTGHGEGQRVQAEKLSNGKFVVLGKTYDRPEDVFNAGTRDIVNVYEL